MGKRILACGLGRRGQQSQVAKNMGSGFKSKCCCCMSLNKCDFLYLLVEGGGPHLKGGGVAAVPLPQQRWGIDELMGRKRLRHRVAESVSV